MQKVDLGDLEIRYEFALHFLSNSLPPHEAFIDNNDMSLNIRFNTGRGDDSCLLIVYPKHLWRWRQSLAN